MSAPYGELVMVVGDAHVGHRAFDIPDKFKKMLSPDKMQHLVSTGNLCAADTYDFFRSVAPKMHAVRGDMDDSTSCNTSAEELVFEVGEFRIGVCHGHQVVPWGDRDALSLLARRLDVDILVTGHTHVCEAFEVEGTWFVNPGSITGAYTPLREDVKPSFVLLSIQANTVKLYMYELNGLSGEVDIRRAKFTKPSKNPFGGAPPLGMDSSFTAPSLLPSPAKTQPQSTAVPAQKRPLQTIAPSKPVEASNAPVKKAAAFEQSVPPASTLSDEISANVIGSEGIVAVEPVDIAPPLPAISADAIFGTEPIVNMDGANQGLIVQDQKHDVTETLATDDGGEHWDDV